MEDISEYISGLCEVGDINEGIYKELMDKLKVVYDKKDKYIKITYDKIINMAYQAEDNDCYYEDDMVNEYIKSVKTNYDTQLYIKIMDSDNNSSIKNILESIFRFGKISSCDIECLKKNINNLHIIVQGIYSNAVVIKSVEEI